MKKRLMIIASVILLGLTSSCEDQLDEVTPTTVIEVESENVDSDRERARPGDH